MFVRIDRSFGERRERLRSRIRQLIRLPKRVLCAMQSTGIAPAIESRLQFV